MKSVYEFTVKNGKEKVKVFFSKPSNSDIEDAEYIYGQKFNELLNDGFLSRAMMNKKFDDIGGVLSDKKVSQMGEQVKQLLESQRTVEFFEGADNLTDEQKEELDKAKETFGVIQKQIAETDLQLQQMYSQSADAKAEQYMIKFFVLNNSHFYEKVKVGDDYKEEPFDIFEGGSFKEKQEELNNLLEDLGEGDDPVLSKKKTLAKDSYETLQKVAALWYNGLASDQSSTKKALKEYYES